VLNTLTTICHSFNLSLKSVAYQNQLIALTYTPKTPAVLLKRFIDYNLTQFASLSQYQFYLNQSFSSNNMTKQV